MSSQMKKVIKQAIADIGWQQRKLGHGKWKVLDIAWRFAGLGTLGLPRFVILVHVTASKKSDQLLATEGDLLLLNLKCQPGSVMAPFLKGKQPRFASEAERVVAIERRLQAMSPAFLTTISMMGESYTLRELQPETDKLDLKQIRAETGRLHLADLREGIEVMGRLTAWSHLRSAARQGSVESDALIEFGGRSHWVKELLTISANLAEAEIGRWKSMQGWLLAEATRLAPLTRDGAAADERRLGDRCRITAGT